MYSMSLLVFLLILLVTYCFIRSAITKKKGKSVDHLKLSVKAKNNLTVDGGGEMRLFRSSSHEA